MGEYDQIRAIADGGLLESMAEEEYLEEEIVEEEYPEEEITR